ncbi:alternate-type signal peptide domain-containing protein [Nocardioides sp. SYSU D00038]|uniref:alternate-type signal peptide domain-containing protein n=1 Tax=Nocardioides sp. SYSU D00038 TaxID=2812554 RepID=UPI0019670D14|nr:alternate-type signal peptide domain-containing protein [Nocardioides sp. SYSU D00038]
MRKTTKGALAAGAAAVLMLGGAGTLAFWSDDATVNGGSVDAGLLSLTAGTCDTEWTYANGTDAGEEVGEIVPGDAITKDCTFTIAAEGDHLTATPTVPDEVEVADVTGNTAESLELTVGASYAVDGAPLTGASVITEDNNGDTLTASITVTFPFGNAEGSADEINVNDTQNITATLDDLTVTLTQTTTGLNPNA